MAQDRFIFDDSQGSCLAMRCSAVETALVTEQGAGVWRIAARSSSGDSVFLPGSYASEEEACEAMVTVVEQFLNC